MWFRVCRRAREETVVWDKPKGVGKAAVALARERVGDAKRPALDLKGSDTAKPQVREANTHTVGISSIF